MNRIVNDLTKRSNMLRVESQNKLGRTIIKKERVKERNKAMNLLSHTLNFFRKIKHPKTKLSSYIPKDSHSGRL